jgi:hypothetical protein
MTMNEYHLEIVSKGLFQGFQTTFHVVQTTKIRQGEFKFWIMTHRCFCFRNRSLYQQGKNFLPESLSQDKSCHQRSGNAESLVFGRSKIEIQNFLKLLEAFEFLNNFHSLKAFGKLILPHLAG